jgi:N-acyl-D-amino-acid deacylase
VADVLLRGGVVIDGAGNPGFRADVSVTGDRITEVGRLTEKEARTVIDVSGLTVAPGFIDMHAHSDLKLLSEPDHEAKVHQGVTLDVLGQDGLSYAPVDDEVLAELRRQLRGWNGDPPGFDWDWRTVSEYLDRLDRGIAVNAAYLVPHGTIRMMAMGQSDGAPTSDQIDHMRRLVATGLEEGAVGMSAGLTYAPAMYADDDELVELCRVVASYGGYYCPHHRNYGATALEAYADCIEVARRSGCPLHYAHCHLGFEINKGRAGELLSMIDAARADGVEVTMDTYPYLAGSTYLHSVLPSWCHVGGHDATIARLSDPGLRERLRVELEESGSDGFQGVPIDWSVIVISGTSHERNAHLVGQNIVETAAAADRPIIDFFCDLLVDEDLGTACVEHIGNEENVRQIMTHPAHMASSDGILEGDRPHPRAWGTFPRYIGHYARELGVITVEEAVRKMTSAPAFRLGFTDRGLVRPGMAADLVCFDRETIIDRATYEDPRRQPEGIPYVMVNGVFVLEDGSHTGRLPGRALRRTGSQASKAARIRSRAERRMKP